MNRMHILHVVIYLLAATIIGIIFFIYFQRRKSDYRPSVISEPASTFKFSGSALEGNFEKGNVSIVNPAQFGWQIYNNGTSTVDLSKDFAQALLVWSNQNEKYELPDTRLFETLHGGPYTFQISPHFEFDFFVVLSHGVVSNLDGGNSGKYISRVSIMVPHSRNIRQNALSLFCNVSRIFIEESTSREKISAATLILWASSGGINKEAVVNVNGGGVIKISF